MPRPNLLGLLEDAAARGEQTALSRRDGLRLERWSWARLHRSAHGVAAGLAARGVAAGDRVVLRAPAGPKWMAGFWGCLLRGAVVVPLDLEGPGGFVDRVMRQVDPRLSLDESLLGELIESPAAGGASLPGRGDLAEIVFTSGTTAIPKGVCLTHGNLLASIEPFEEGIARHRHLARAAGPLRFLCALPLTHVYGQISAVFVPPLLGAGVHFPSSLKSREIVDSVRQHRVNVLPCVPRQLELLREHVEREARRRGRLDVLRRDLARADRWGWPRRWWAFRHMRRAFGWRFWVFSTGGAALSRETELFWRRLGYVVLQGYGLTETAALATLDDPFRSRRGSIGRPLSGREIRVGEDGQVFVRGEAVSPGYWEGEVRPLTGSDGWLPTGDLVERDSSGALIFRGRAKEVIVTGSGQNVFPADLEAALEAQPAVRSCAVVAHEGPRGPEAVAVLLLGAPGEEAVSGILSLANATLAPHQHLRRALVWPGADLPRTPGTLKVKRDEVAEWVARRLEAPRPATGAPEGPEGRGPLASMIAAVGGEPPVAVGADTRLEADLNLDSLGQLELLSALEERYQVDLDEGVLSPEATVGDLERLLHGSVGEAGPPYPFPRWAERPAARALRAALQLLVVLPLAQVLCPLEVRGREHLHSLDEPALFVCNHVTMVDGGLVVAALPARLRGRLAIAMSGEILRDWRHPAAEALWHQRFWGPPLYAATALLFGVYPLPQKSGFRSSFAYAGELVDRGRSLLVFPEGLRTRDGGLGPFLPGIGLMAEGLRVPVVPLRIGGLWAVKQRGGSRARRGEVAITVGAPARYEPGADPAAIARDLERRVAALA